MIVKYFYHNKWQLGEDWENTDYVFRILGSGMQVKQNKKSIVASLELSNNEESIEEVEDEELSLPSYGYT
jgi:beta-lactamase superfamily II metal-dependent hydrolase